MNRRRFLELLSSATITAGVAYSFPSVIVPRNIGTITIPEMVFDSTEFNLAGSQVFRFESMWAIPTKYAIRLPSSSSPRPFWKESV